MNWLKEFFSTTSSERNGAIVLLVIIGCFGLYYILMYNNQPAIFIIEDNSVDNNRSVDSIIEKNNQFKYFKFDPNKIDINDWMDLGFSANQSKSIIKYRFSLGGFKKPEELLSCYVIDSIKYFELLPYINISIKDIDEGEIKRNEISQLNCFAVFLVSSREPIYEGFDQMEELYFLSVNLLDLILQTNLLTQY